MSSLKERLMAKKKAEKQGGSGSSIRDRFQKRKTDVLESTFKNKDSRISGGGGGRSIFNQALLEELGIIEFRPNTRKEGSYFYEIFPTSFNPDIPYFIELAIHDGVGVNNDSFICMTRYRTAKNCYRCQKQKELYKLIGSPTDEIKALYPRDKVVYIGWDRSKELGGDEDPVFQVSVWAAPKIGVHAEIQKKVRDKITKQILDISDLSEDGQGRTVYFDVGMKEVVDAKTKAKKVFPDYNGFDLVKRDTPIPEEILEKLESILSELENRMTKDMENPLEVLLHIPEDGELEEAMGTEVHSGDDNGNGDKKEDAPKPSTGKKMSKLEEIRARKAAKQEKQKKSDTIDLDELEAELDKMNRDEIIEWADQNKLIEILEEEMDDNDMKVAILEYVSERIKEGDDLPF